MLPQSQVVTNNYDYCLNHTALITALILNEQGATRFSNNVKTLKE